MVTKEEYDNAVRELIKMGTKNKYGLSYFEKEEDIKNLMLAGGVSANSGIREAFDKLCKENDINLSVPKLAYCTDNAAMIAAAGYFYYLDNRFSDYSLKINPSLDLDYEN